MLLSPLTALVKAAVVQAVAETYAESSRWTIVKVAPGLVVHGLAYGRRWAKALGVACVLALRDDGLFTPRLVPVDVVIVSVNEMLVRAHYVTARRPAYAPRGHTFTASPVYGGLCRHCALPALHHDRVRVQIVVERVVQIRDVRATFRDDTAELVDVLVRETVAERPVLNKVPLGEGEVAPVEPPPERSGYRPLTPREWHAVARDLRVIGLDVAVAQALSTIGSAEVSL